MNLCKVLPALAAVVLLAGSAVIPVAAQAQEAHPHVVGGRLENQHDRIQAGVKAGTLTKAEAARLRARDASIHARATTDRAHHSGKLTRAERARLNRRLNHTSKAIHRDTHNSHNR